MKRLYIGTLAASLLCCAVAVAQTDDGEQVYAVDAASSSIFWQVYSAGKFAKLGHNHVIAVSELSGRIQLGGGDAPSRFELQFPVASLVVDDPGLRGQRGEKFRSQPTDKDIAGTKRNMLGDKVLDAEHYPMIRLSGTYAGANLSDAMLAVTVQLLGRSVQLRMPASVRIDGDLVTADGQATLTHADLGMMPFSVMLGALQVAENIDFFYHVVGRRTPGAQ